MGKDLIRGVHKRNKISKARQRTVRKKNEITNICRSIVEEIVENAINAVSQHNLTYEKEEDQCKIEGYRFVEMDYFFKKALSLQSLHNLKCTGGKLEYSSEKRSGLVQKIECVNHCIKNYSKHLYRIKKDTKSIALETRKLLTNHRIKDLTRNAQKAIYANAHGDISQLKHDLQNSVPCSFGNHSKCQTYLCNHVGDTASDNMSQLLIDNETNNRAELFMSLLARFNMGKRLNLIQRDGFQMRSYLSALRYNVGQSWHHKSWKQYFKKSPSKILKTYMIQQEEKHRKRTNTIRVKHSAVKRLKFDTTNKENNRDYGLNISEVFMTTDEIKDETNKLLERLKVNYEKQLEIARDTIEQFENPKYVSERAFRSTASHFGAVIRRRATTSCNALVKTILRATSSTCTAAMEYERAGLYIDVDHGFLGASPDDVINKNEIIEVKCMYKVAQLGLSVQQERKCITCLEKDLQNKIRLRRNHDYFFQIQGQLAITGAEICYFRVYTGDKNDIFIEEIKADKDIWNTIMLPKLIDFYVNCIAPNIIENRPGRGLQWKDPPSIIEAQNALRTKKEQTKQKRQE
ncbi:hypothetical protein ILUMI_17290 [Ignelater luminosus]|uniref:YqaJ viral recombinase domain-containing protein n=1 Tax=Ignelater luminosus TaxID=2038154 RepID=A0A8K0G824_IGNLU|nr:hypothetical protein ILUMI_17290 [Ignelater luminosus]